MHGPRRCFLRIPKRPFLNDQGSGESSCGSSPMQLPSCAEVVHRVGALLRRLVPKPVQDLRNLLREGRLQLAPPLPPHQVMQQHLWHDRIRR